MSLSFESKLHAALDRVRAVLDATKVPCLPADVHHKYQDKFFLAESMTNVAIASQVNALASLGLSKEQLVQLSAWASNNKVSLRFTCREEYALAREETREVESPSKVVTEVTEVAEGGSVSTTLASKVVTKITEYFWSFNAKYELVAVRGVGKESTDCLQILSRTCSTELKTTVHVAPPVLSARKQQHFEREADITWLLARFDAESLAPRFEVDRAHAKCHTPRRNPEVEAACRHFQGFRDWSSKVADWLRSLFKILPESEAPFQDLSALSSSQVLVPVLPMLRESGASASPETAAAGAAAAAAGASPETVTAGDGQAGVFAALTTQAAPEDCALFGAADTNRLLEEEARSLREKLAAVRRDFSAFRAAGSLEEAALIVTCNHIAEVCDQWQKSVDYIENLLRKQLIAAIGKEVSPTDFADYMCFHNRKLFAESYAPVPFCFAVRRSELHSPEGTISIEEWAGDKDKLISTLVARGTQPHTMQFPLNASTRVSFGGERYLHGFLSHRFSGRSSQSLTLVSRARQFSSMLVLVGRIASAHAFEPKYASIVQNKDELRIPLDLSMIPTPKEFKDAISSLSPEQQRFAKAFRSMQLESTLFGVLVIQIKPQLEKVLNLPENSLTKEIKLTQDLMQLFTKYQIPTDLLSFDADGLELVGGASGTERLDAVKGHVRAMQEMIEQAQKEEIEERQRQAAWRAGARPSKWVVEEEEEEEEMDFDLFDGCAPGARGAALGSAPRSAPAPPPPPCPAPVACAARSAPPPPQACAAMAPAQNQASLGSSSFSQNPPPKPQPQPQPQPQAAAAADAASAGHVARDYTKVPKEMDRNFEKLDSDNALRPTIINPRTQWTKRSQKALLAQLSTDQLFPDDLNRERDAAFDLLDAVTKSGALPVEHASLHVVVAATHCFDKTVTEAVIQDNMNPIEKVERSTLIMASTLHGLRPTELIQGSQRQRVEAASPMLFLEDSQDGE